MNDLIQSLRREKAMLEAELRKDARYVKIEHINALLTAYGASEAASARPEPHKGGFGPQSAKPSYGAETKKERVRRALRDFLQERSFGRRQEMLAYLTQTGLLGHERKPMKQLSAYLTRFPEFVTDGAGQWRLDPSKLPENAEPSGSSPEGGHQTAQ